MSSGGLPNPVGFRGDNRKLLCLTTLQSSEKYADYLFFGADDVSDPLVAFQAFQNPDGKSICIQSIQTGKYWEKDENNNILVSADEASTTNSNCWFKKEDIQVGVITLRNLGNANYCQRLIRNNGLVALSTSINDRAKLTVVTLPYSK